MAVSTIPNFNEGKSKVLVNTVNNIGSPYSLNLNADGSGRGTFLVNVRRYGTQSFDGVYWLGIISILYIGGVQKWGMTVLDSHNNSATDGYNVTMSGTTLTITSLSGGSSNYAYLTITKIA